MYHYPPHLNQMIAILKKFPGVGQKSAERFAFQLLEWPEHQLHEMATCLSGIPEAIKFCDLCGCLKGQEPCSFCKPEREETKVLCIVSHFKDVLAIEQTHEYRGLYHVLGGLLSPLEDVGIEDLNLNNLRKRLQQHGVEEVIVALDSTLEGDATALHLKQELEGLPVKVSRLAFGLPMGSALDYVDGGTLARAFSGRRNF